MSKKKEPMHGGGDRGPLEGYRVGRASLIVKIRYDGRVTYFHIRASNPASWCTRVLEEVGEVSETVLYGARTIKCIA